MNIIILILSLAFFPTVIGYGSVKAYAAIRKHIIKTGSQKKESVFCRLTAAFTTGAIEILLYSGIINALSVFINLTVSSGSQIFCLGIIFITFFSILFIVISMLVSRHKKKSSASSEPKTQNATSVKTTRFGIITALLLLALVLAVIQIIIVVNSHVAYTGDQTLETVVSFTNTNHIYSVDPLTGLPYLNGYPIRLSLQCLPFLYSVLSTVFSVSPIIIVWKIMPAFWLICGYCSIFRIAGLLYKNKTLALLMLISFEFLLWCSNSGNGAIGFNVFHIGYSSITVLELLLIYWSIAAILSHNSIAVLLSIVTEPLVASTRFGVGACFFITLIYIIIIKIPYTRRIVSSLDARLGGEDGKA